MSIVDVVSQQRKMPEPMVWSYKQVAAALGVCEKTVYNLQKAGKLKPLQVGGSVKFLPSEVKAYLDSLTSERDTSRDKV